MQLLLILALLIYAGKGDGGKLLSEVQPVLESLGGEEIKEAIRNAEELKGVLSAIGAVSRQEDSAESVDGETGRGGNERGDCFPLAPVCRIADKDITYCLSRYLSEEGAD